MSKYNLIEPWKTKFKAFLLLYIFSISVGSAQNTLKREFDAQSIETISINGNQIFNIYVKSTQTDRISITSTLDGEYQNKYQIASKIDGNELVLSLEFMTFEAIPDDKRNAHKVIAAELTLEIPDDLNLKIKSDIGSANISGNYKSLHVELLQGYCKVEALSKRAILNTIDGKIDVITKNADIRAYSKHGKVSLDSFNSSENQWDLNSINGNITVVKME